jgi:hypothetical protein
MNQHFGVLVFYFSFSIISFKKMKSEVFPSIKEMCILFRYVNNFQRTKFNLSILKVFKPFM